MRVERSELVLQASASHSELVVERARVRVFTRPAPERRDRVEVTPEAVDRCRCRHADDDGHRHVADLRMRLYALLVEAFTGRPLETLDPAELDGDVSAPELDDPRSARDRVRAGAAAAPSSGAEVDISTTRYEAERVTFRADAVVRTADGREIRVAVDVGMQRERLEHAETHLRFGAARATDPLVLDFAGTGAQLEQTTFAFDLDADGADDAMRFVRPGAGFLALDRNGNGRVDDGTELFGPATGDGFRDLGAHDDDGNGWIDEGDAVWRDLRVWERVAGSDRLTPLADWGVGAISLASVATPFEQQGQDREALGVLRSTGIWLGESGGAGAVHQVDIVA